MKNFKDTSGLCSVLQVLHQEFPSDPEQRRAVFAEVLEEQFDFTKDQAALYASTVLTRNAEGSPDWVGSSAIKVLGTWINMSQQGMAAGWLKSVTETWHFSNDLNCEHKLETYEGYMSPFGSGYSRPSSTRETFLWASSDSDAQSLKVVIVPWSGGSARILTFAWMDDQSFPRKCSINGITFVKQ